jgi:type II secretion system (T2SS) protein N
VAGSGVPKRGAKPPPPPPPRSAWPRIAIAAALIAAAVVVAALPAALIARFLPRGVAAEDFSGTVWHGSAGRLTYAGRDAGALEWHLHPASLLRLHVAADLHWVKGGFVLDGSADAGKRELSVSGIQGGGPIADVQDLGAPPGWRGTVGVRIERLSAELSEPGPALRSAVGEIDVANASSQQIAASADLGSYALKFDDPSLDPDGQASATLTDTGGPLDVDATISLSPKARTGLLSGTIKERVQIPEALRRELEQVAQLHARDAQGRIPVDLEFSY